MPENKKSCVLLVYVYEGRNAPYVCNGSIYVRSGSSKEPIKPADRGNIEYLYERSKEYIKEYIVNEFAYDLSRTCDEIRPGFRHIEICQKTVPEALTAFFEGDGFEDVVRTAVSLGGDCDTVTCIAASIAEAFYGVPEAITQECIKRIPEEMNEVLKRIS